MPRLLWPPRARRGETNCGQALFQLRTAAVRAALGSFVWRVCACRAAWILFTARRWSLPRLTGASRARLWSSRCACHISLERVAYTAYGVARHQWQADATGDGAVDAADMSLVLSSYGPITSANYKSEADFTRDGVIDSADLSPVLVFQPTLPEGALSAPSVGNRVGYCGYRFAPETEMYLARNRWNSPPLGRWIQRDPLGYVDGMALYEYTAGIAIAVADPTGLATIGACSGINMRGRNYVADWLDDNDYTIDERFLLASTCHAGNGSICQGYVVHPLSRVTLDEEAERLGSTARMPSLCRADGQRAKLEIVMVSPKTNETPMDAGLKGSAGDGWTADCCDIRFTIVDDPKDDVPNQSVFDDFARGRQPLWDRYGNAIRVDNVRCCDCCSSYQDGLFARHDFFNFLGCPRGTLRLEKLADPWPSSRWVRDGGQVSVRSLIDSAAERAGNDGTVIVCHSQGCNILMNQLQNLCGCSKKP